MSSNNYSLSGEAKQHAITFGLTDEMVSYYVDNSVPLTHPDGNRRYHRWMFLVDGQKVLSIGTLSHDPLSDRRRQKPRPQQEEAVVLERFTPYSKLRFF